MASALGSSAPLSSHLATLTADLAIAKEQVRSITTPMSGRNITPYLTVCHMHLELLKKALQMITATNRTMQQRIRSIPEGPARTAYESACSSTQRTIKDLSTQIGALRTELNKKDLRWQLYKINEFLLLQADPKERLKGADIVRYFTDPKNSFDIDNTFQCCLPRGFPPLTRTLSDPEALAEFIEAQAPALRDHLIDLIGPDTSFLNKGDHRVPLTACKGTDYDDMEALDRGLGSYFNKLTSLVSSRSLACDKERELDEDALRSIEDALAVVVTNRDGTLHFVEGSSTFVQNSALLLFPGREDLQNRLYNYYVDAVWQADKEIGNEGPNISYLSMCVNPAIGETLLVPSLLETFIPFASPFPLILTNAKAIEFAHVPSLIEALRNMRAQHIEKRDLAAAITSSLQPFPVLAEEINHRAQEILRGTSSATTATAAAAAHGGGGAAAAASTAASEPAATARSMLSPNFERYCRAIIDVHTYYAVSAARRTDAEVAAILGLEELKNRAEKLLTATTPCDETTEANYFDSYSLPSYIKADIQRTLEAVDTEPHFGGGGAAAAASRAAAPAAAAPHSQSSGYPL